MAILDLDIIQAFATDGFVVTPDLIDLEEFNRYGQAVDEAVARRTPGRSTPLAERSIYEQTFVQCMRLWETDPEVASLTFHPRLAQVASELLGVAKILLWQDQALYKGPGGRITDAHQDAAFWPIG
ncbi:MAG: phytanoyl-CoA dioxygenase family protein, partial [Actinomycetia bacterium]|nr:phytanoyl-CoA dioxygenase family protein [Actinomycetes bacterium]